MKNEHKTYTASTRLNRDQIKRLDAKAMEEGMTRSVLVKHILLQYLDKDIEHTNLLQAAINNVNEKIDKTSTKIEFFQQLFFYWLVNWFASHPKIDDSNQIQIAKNSTLRRDKFCENFINDFYNENSELFDRLFANHVENEEINGKN